MDMETRLTKLMDVNPFISSPADFLVTAIVEELKKEEAFVRVYGEYVDPYKRVDYPIRALPALRVYSETLRQLDDNGWALGEVKLDSIFPASLRREELQRIPDLVSGVLLQQFRRQPFINAICPVVPGLNQLGKTVEIRKDLQFMWNEELVPLTQITVNFRIDLRQWDDFLESDCRTPDEPFERTLSELRRITGTIQGLRDDGTVGVALEYDTRIPVPDDDEEDDD